MNQTLRQRSALVQAAERALSREPAGIRGDRLVFALAVVLIFVLLGVA